jgi:integrase
MLSNYVELKKKGPDDFIVTTRLGNKKQPYTSGCSLNRTLKLYCKKANIKDWEKMHNHSFRHMFCTKTIRRCGIEIAQTMMRHKNI